MSIPANNVNIVVSIKFIRKIAKAFELRILVKEKALLVNKSIETSVSKLLILKSLVLKDTGNVEWSKLTY